MEWNSESIKLIHSTAYREIYSFYHSTAYREHNIYRNLQEVGGGGGKHWIRLYFVVVCALKKL